MGIRGCVFALRSIIPQAATIYTIYIRDLSSRRILLCRKKVSFNALRTQIWLFFRTSLFFTVAPIARSVSHSLYTRKRLDVSTHSSSSSTGATIAGLAVEPPGASRYNSVVSGSAFSTITWNSVSRYNLPSGTTMVILLSTGVPDVAASLPITPFFLETTSGALVGTLIHFFLLFRRRLRQHQTMRHTLANKARTAPTIIRMRTSMEPPREQWRVS